MTNRSISCLVLSLVLAVGASGCSALDSPEREESFQGVSGHDEKVRPEDSVDVAALPFVADEAANMDRLIDDLSQIVDSVAPVGPWERLREDSRFPCSVEGFDGVTRSISLRSLVSTTGVPADKVSQVQDALVARAEKDGFRYDGEFPKVPGEWDFRMSASDGRTLQMGDGGNVRLTGETGCRRDTKGPEGDDIYDTLPEELKLDSSEDPRNAGGN